MRSFEPPPKLGVQEIGEGEAIMDRGYFGHGGAIYLISSFLIKYLPMFEKILPDVIARINE